MPLIIDTFNVLHVTGVLPPDLAGLDVRELAELVAVSRYGRDTITLVCDGKPPRSRQIDSESRRGAGVQAPPPPHLPGGRSDATAQRIGSVVVRYSGVGIEADDVIGRMIQRSSAPRSLLIVSTDRRIRAMAARRRCAWLSSEAFLAQLADDRRNHPTRAGTVVPGSPSTPLSTDETLRWATELGLDAADLERSVDDLIDGDQARRATTPNSPAPRRIDPPPPARAPRSSSNDQPASVRPRATRYRPIDQAERPEEIDPTELERFDLEAWMRDHHRHDRTDADE